MSTDLGVSLTFDSVTQKLVHVSVEPREVKSIDESDRFVPIEWTYAGSQAFGYVNRPDCRRLMAIFPPTTLGKFNESDFTYSMDYKSGIRFRLKMDGSARFKQFQSKTEHPVNIDSYSPLIESMDISDSTVAVSFANYEIFPKEGIRLNDKSWLKLGCGLQDVFSVLGPPEDVDGEYYYFYKSGIAVKVNRYNYSSVEQFRIYTNFPGHLLFGQYNRAMFKLCTKKKELLVNNQSSLKELQKSLGDPGQPLVVNSPFTSQVQHFYSFEGIVFELCPNGGIVSVQVM